VSIYLSYCTVGDTAGDDDDGEQDRNSQEVVGPRSSGNAIISNGVGSSGGSDACILDSGEERPELVGRRLTTDSSR
jgi:hypothetical protein